MKKQIKVIFKGRVQGVFFRAHTIEYAKKFKITGYVKNLEDGSVELLAVGEQSQLDQFIKKVVKKPGYGCVDTYDIEELDMDDRYIDFVSL